MADPSDLTQALLPSFVLSLNCQCLSVDMGAKTTFAIKGVASQERCRVSRKNDYPDIICSFYKY